MLYFGVFETLESGDSIGQDEIEKPLFHMQ